MVTHVDVLAPALQLVAQHGQLAIVDAVKMLAGRPPVPTVPVGRHRDPRTPAFRLVSTAAPPLSRCGRSNRVGCTLRMAMHTLWGSSGGSPTAAPATLDDLKMYPCYNEYSDSEAAGSLASEEPEPSLRPLCLGPFALHEKEPYGRRCGHGIRHRVSPQGCYGGTALILDSKPRDGWFTPTVWSSSTVGASTTSSCGTPILPKTSCDTRPGTFSEGTQVARRGRFLAKQSYISWGGSTIATYDDCITQLDRGLATIYGTQALRLGVHALYGFFVSASMADAFFHDNVFAVEHLAEYRAMADSAGTPPRLNIDEHLLDRQDLLFARDNLPYPGVTYSRG